MEGKSETERDESLHKLEKIVLFSSLSRLCIDNMIDCCFFLILSLLQDINSSLNTTSQSLMEHLMHAIECR